MPQLILTTKKGREIVHAVREEKILEEIIWQIRHALINNTHGIDVTYTDLLGKNRRLIISTKFLRRVTISTL